MLGFLFPSKKRTAGERFPADDITIGQGEAEGLPAVAMLNRAYKHYPFGDDFPWHVQVEVTLLDKRENGFPSNAEAEVLNAAEDRLEAALKEVGALHFIARQTWNGKRMIDYYVENGETAEAVLKRLQADPAIERPLSYKLTHDPSWSIGASFFAHC